MQMLTYVVLSQLKNIARCEINLYDVDRLERCRVLNYSVWNSGLKANQQIQIILLANLPNYDLLSLEL